MPSFYWTWMLDAAALGHLGEIERAAKAPAEARALVPCFDPRAELHKWNAAPDDLERIMDGLTKAGYTEA